MQIALENVLNEQKKSVFQLFLIFIPAQDMQIWYNRYFEILNVVHLCLYFIPNTYIIKYFLAY